MRDHERTGGPLDPRFRGDDGSKDVIPVQACPRPRSGTGIQWRRVLIAGVSTRALAESAARAGYPVCAVDAFGDLDHPGRPALSLARDCGTAYDALAAAHASRDLATDVVCYVSNFENHPRALTLLAEGRTLWGNPSAVLARARDPLHVARVLRARGFAVPRVRATAHAGAAPSTSATRWLAKPRASGGGHGIAPWRPRAGRTLPRTHVLQERITGPSGSLAFVANGRDAVPFAWSRQLIGDPAFGATGFRYCGSILARDALAPEGAAPAEQPLAALERATEMARALTRELTLVGVNGLDFVVRGGTPYPVEVNPRHSASMELAERAFAFSVFAAHAHACAAGALPSFDLARALTAEVGALGKAVLFARRTLTVGDTRRWLGDADVRDIPHPGELIPRGRPICTIFARGRDAADCYAQLARRARKMYAEIERWR
jgi:predicted ATP-grasp superfamily ATP-dependent carboligase